LPEPAESDTQPAFELAAAILCERVLEEKDGTLSAVRIVDRVTIDRAHAPGANVVTVIGPATLALLVMFRHADPRREYEVVLTVEDPSGSKKELTPSGRVRPGGETNGGNFIGRLTFAPQGVGLYRFLVAIDGKQVAAVPLSVVEVTVEEKG
jgi:hypothetical protein